MESGPAPETRPEAAAGRRPEPQGERPEPQAPPAAPSPSFVLGQFSPIQRLLITTAAIAVTLLFMRITAGIIVPVLLALVVTMAVSPFLDWQIRHRVPPIAAWLATVILTTAAVVFVFVLGGIGIARLISELNGYLTELTVQLGDATGVLGQVGIHLEGLFERDGLLPPHRIISFSVRILQLLQRLFGAVGLTLLIVFFMLAESITLRLKVLRAPPRVNPLIQRLELFTRDMRAFVQATALIGLVNGVAAGLFLYLLGIEFPLIWGLLAFLLTFIPTLGFFIAVIPPCFFALLEQGWRTALLVFIGYIVIWAITGTLRSGRFVGRRLNLAPIVILLSIILWGWVLGIMGGLLAVPMTLLVRRVLLEAYDESRWITDLLGRPGRPPVDDAGARPPGDGGAPS
jgi:predicted PurR-regulated permease PerM